jgi:hypothetical protein
MRSLRVAAAAGKAFWYPSAARALLCLPTSTACSLPESACCKGSGELHSLLPRLFSSAAPSQLSSVPAASAAAPFLATAGSSASSASRPSQLHICVTCFRHFPSAALLSAHERRHSQRRPHRCTLCDAAFTHSSTLTTHVFAVHQLGGRQAAAAAASPAALFPSASSTSAPAPLSVAAAAAPPLVPGRQPHPCPHCVRVFPSARLLSDHIRRHLGERPFRCRHAGCALSFTSTGGRALHEKLHSRSVKAFACTGCHELFTSRWNVRRHRQRMHAASTEAAAEGETDAQRQLLERERVQKPSSRRQKAQPSEQTAASGRSAQPAAHIMSTSSSMNTG